MSINIKKKIRIKELIKLNKYLFKCPICNEDMFINEIDSLVCESNHSFDMARKGYINLLTSKITSFYSKELFEARHTVCNAGFYTPLIIEITKIIDDYIANLYSEKINILDAGCGEGSHLYSVLQTLKNSQNNTYVGVDISKDSINIASRNNADIIWCVADLAKLPFQTRAFDVILNILSPANYSEFNRVLYDEGIIIKVVPGNNYLKELRDIIYDNKEFTEYSNSNVINHFNEMSIIHTMKNINYRYDVSKELLPDLIKMTPLTLTKDVERLNRINHHNLSSITIDLTIIVGTKKRI